LIITICKQELPNLMVFLFSALLFLSLADFFPDIPS
jgi:hypothetical protein